MNQFPTAPSVVLPPSWYSEEAPEVSIVILNYNKPELTQACLEHIWAYTTDRSYEIIVVDNGSTPENAEILRGVAGPFRLVRLEINRYFGEGNNIGAEAARGTYIVFLNNDAFVTEGWLAPLMRRLEEEPLIGGVGPRFLYPDGRVQEAGAFVGAEGHAVQVGKFGAYAPDDIEEDHIVDYVSAACFLVRRELFLAVGGFEYAYEPAYYEDVDLCLKIAARGLFIAYCAASQVIHIENATSSSNRDKLGLHNIIDINRGQFLKFWKDNLLARERNALRSAPSVRPPEMRPRAVFYTPFNITPGGGERYILTAATALLPDFDVYLVTEETYSRTRMRAIGRDLALDLDALQLVERRNLHKLGPIDVSVLMSNEAVPPFPGFAARNLYICQFPFPVPQSENERRGGNLESFAEIIVYSGFVRDCLRTQQRLLGVTACPVDIITPPVPSAPPGHQPAPLKPPYRLVLVGRFFSGGHNKRHDIAIEAVRRLHAAGVPVELDLVGGLMAYPEHRAHFAKLMTLAESLPITFHPNASPATLSTILGRSHFYIHGAGYGVDTEISPHECEHFGISVLEAMSYGLVPFVVAAGGPTSFVLEGRTGYIYKTVEELIAKIAAALSNPDKVATVRTAAIAESAQYSEETFASAWRAKANALLAQPVGMAVR